MRFSTLAVVLILGLLAMEAFATLNHFNRPRRSWRRKRSCFRRRHSSNWNCRYKKRVRIVCPPQPSTGCFQSDNVTFTPTASGGHDDFTWLEPLEDYDLDLERPALGDNNRRYALCVYDADDIDQDEDQAPLDSGSSLVLSNVGPEISGISGSNISFSVNTNYHDYIWTYTLHGVSNPVVQLVSLVDGDFTCWTKSISVILPSDNLPEDPSTYGYTPISSRFGAINASLVDLVGVDLRAGEKTVQDRIDWAARYYYAHSDQTDALDMQEFILEQGPLLAWYDTITTLDISTNEGEDLSEDAGLYHTFAYYAATIFQRDIFQNISVQFQTGDPESYLSYAVPLGLRVANFGVSDYQFDIIDDNFFKNPDPVATVGGNVLDVVRTYGQVAGYLAAAIRQGVMAGSPPESDFITCDAYDLCTPPVLPSNCKSPRLVPCTFDLDYLPITEIYNDFSVVRTAFNGGNDVNGTILDAAFSPALVNISGDREYQELLDAQDEGFSIGFNTFTSQQDEAPVSADNFPAIYALASGQLQFLDLAIQLGMIADSSSFSSEVLFNVAGGDSIVASLFFRRAFETIFSRFTANPPASPSIPQWSFGITPDVSASI